MPVLLDEILAGLRRTTRDDLRRLLDAWGKSLDEGGAEALREAQPDMAPAFVSLAQVAEAARGEQPGDLSGFVRDGGQTAARAGAGRAALGELVTGFNRTVRALASRSEALEALGARARRRCSPRRAPALRRR